MNNLYATMKWCKFVPTNQDVLEMVKKKSPSIVSTTNELVKNFSGNRDLDFILNPVSYTQIRGNFSLVQTNLMIGIIGQF